MADQLALDLVGQRLVTDQLTLTVGYDIDNLREPDRRKQYQGAVTTDRYGRQIPKHAHGTANLEGYTDSAKRITEAVLELFDRIVNRDLLVRRLYLTANRMAEESSISVAHTMAWKRSLEFWKRKSDNKRGSMYGWPLRTLGCNAFSKSDFATLRHDGLTGRQMGGLSILYIKFIYSASHSDFHHCGFYF